MEIKNIERKSWVVASNQQTTIELSIGRLEDSFLEMVFGNNRNEVLELHEGEQFARHIQGQNQIIVGVTFEEILFNDGSRIMWGDITNWESLSVLDGLLFVVEQEIFNN